MFATFVLEFKSHCLNSNCSGSVKILNSSYSSSKNNILNLQLINKVCFSNVFVRERKETSFRIMARHCLHECMIYLYHFQLKLFFYVSLADGWPSLSWIDGNSCSSPTTTGGMQLQIITMAWTCPLCAHIGSPTWSQVHPSSTLELYIITYIYSRNQTS